jgi:glucosamine--fructose-6-phosphate aminotransferase (isomerizing)
MCGITGYIGGRPAVETALNNLKRLEYRGYDSAGIAYPNCAQIQIVKAAGKIANLERVLNGTAQDTRVAIAHTRWATHGRPNETNAHPHRDCTGRIAVVHNGIIENYAELRRELIAQGHAFASETDTEVLAHLIEEGMRDRVSAVGIEPFAPTREARCLTPVVAAAVRAALRRVTGSYAIAVLSKDAPDAVFVARKDSPLVIGLGENENFLASDIPAVMRYTRRVVLLEDGDFAIITPEKVTVTDLEGRPVTRAAREITWDDEAAEKGGYPHFMLKEIHEGPRTVRNTLRGRLTEDDRVILPELPFTAEDWAKFRRIAIVACGTAYHAGVVGKRFFEQLLRRPVEVTVASEFRYSDPLVDEETLVVLISQSGETADTLAAMREAKAKGATTLAIVNVVGSTLARDADAVLLTLAGPEIGVASTKAYLAQLTALALLGLYLAQNAGNRQRAAGNGNILTPDAQLPTPHTQPPTPAEYVAALRELPSLIEGCLGQERAIAALAETLADQHSFFYLGRGYDYAAALEAALKLKEISYLHAEAYAAGEMKHGPLALVEPGVTIVGFCTQKATNEKMISNLKEVKAREGTVLAVAREGDTVPDCADAVIAVPNTLDALMPVVAMVPMQLLAYHVARVRGCEIDQPRNLAKSVTVE